MYAHNGLEKLLIEHLWLMSKPLLMRTKLPISTRDYVDLYVVRIKPISYKYSPLQLIFDQELNISHLWIFVCAYMFQLLYHNAQRWVNPQIKLRIYINYKPPCISRCFECIGDSIMTWFVITILIQ